MNFINNSNEIKIIPAVCPIYSSGLLALGCAPITSVRITGADRPSPHKISLNIYGMSKAGFFMERTPVFSGELYCEKGSDGFVFDLAPQDFRPHMRSEFFRTLKAPVTGKICVEASIDGKKYIADAPISLLPANVYPSSASPAIFASLLTPCHPDIERICAGIPRPVSVYSLYEALKKERIIYSVRDCDFLAHNMTFDNAGAFFDKHSRMASPFEMALIFCSAALKAGLEPVIVTLKSKKAAGILCGITREKGAFGDLCSSRETVYSLACAEKIVLFDVSCLFTGHSVDPEDAAKSACEELAYTDIVFALDIASALRGGCGLCGFDSAYAAEEEKLLASLVIRPAEERTKSLSAHAELLSDTANSSLLKYSLSSPDSIGVKFSDFSAIPALAASSGSIVLADGNGKEQMTVAGMGDIYEAYRRISSRDGGKNEIYLACGFLSRTINGARKTVSPIALYPVSLSCIGGTVFAEFLSPKPYCNRLLCEKLKESPAGRNYFDSIGIPGGSLESIITCFEGYCSSVHNDYKVIKECTIGIFPYRNSVISFSMVDKSEKIYADRLCAALLSDEKRESAKITDHSYDGAACEVEMRTPDIFERSVYEIAARAADSDILVTDVFGDAASDIPVAAACDNIRGLRSTLIVSSDPKRRRAIEKRFEDIGLSDAVLILSSEGRIKDDIRKKLVSLSAAELPAPSKFDDGELKKLNDKLLGYSRSKERRYDFDFSFDDAAVAFIRAGEGLSVEQKAVILEPESIFFPDLGRESAAALFEAQLKLCRAASALPAVPFSENPLHHARLTENEPDVRTFRHLAEKSLDELDELISDCSVIADKTGFALEDIKTLPALHAFLSLVVLVSKEYDSGITDTLMMSDVYAVSKKLSELREKASRISALENELCEFDREVYTIGAKTLFAEWNTGEKKHSDITKTVNAYRTVNVGTDTVKKSVPDVLALLCSHAELSEEFANDGEEMKDVFAGFWNGTGTDWKKISSLTDFAKMADVLLKKIYGTDQELRKKAAGCLPDTAKYCADKLNVAHVLGAAGLFDRMFADNGSLADLAGRISADLYNMSFADGLLSENGIRRTVYEWCETADLIPAVAEYNRCAAECAKKGLSSFVDYLASHAYTPAAAGIFTRSLLFLALKQMTLYDKTFLAMTDYEKDMARYTELVKEKCAYNRSALKERYLSSCVAHINARPEKTAAFSESLADSRTPSEELLLRYSDTVKTMFPVIIAEPSYAGLLSDHGTVIVCDAEIADTSHILHCLHTATRKLILAGNAASALQGKSFSADCASAGMPHISAAADFGLFGTSLDTCRETEYIKTPVSSFDKERGTNVLEAQTTGLEIMKQITAHPESSAVVLTFTENQKDVVKDVLTVVAEKSRETAKALADRRISVACALDEGVGNCDVLYISTVYDKDDTSGMCISCGTLDDKAHCVCGVPEIFVRALGGSAKKIVVVSTAIYGKYPDTPASHGMMQLSRLALFAGSGGNIVVCDGRDNDIYEPYMSAFCRMMSENGIAVRTIRGGKSAVITVGEKDFGAVIGYFGHSSAYEADVLENSGIIPLYIDSTELVLNPRKITDRIKALKEADE